MKASEEGNLEKVKEILVKAQNNIEAVSKKGYRDIHIKLRMQLTEYAVKAAIESISSCNLELFKYFFENYNVCIDENSFIIAVRHRCIGIIKYMVEKNPSILKFADEAFKFAIISNNLEVMKYLLQQGADINYKEGFALRWSVSHNGADTVKFLLEQGADIEHAFKARTQFTKTSWEKYIETF